MSENLIASALWVFAIVGAFVVGACVYWVVDEAVLKIIGYLG